MGSTTERLSLEQMKTVLETDSFLGGQKIEGVVLKNYEQFGVDKKTLMAKFVRRDFVEDNREDWKRRNPGRADIIQSLIEQYGTEARWMKAVQHLREEDRLVGAPQDIGLLIGEVPADIFKDAEAEIKDALYAAFKKDIRCGVTRGLAEWYKRLLAEDFFA